MVNIQIIFIIIILLYILRYYRHKDVFGSPIPCP